MTKGGQQQRTGPRGGTTTLAPDGRVRKNLWLSAEENEALRHTAFAERTTETALMREGLRLRLGLPSLPAPRAGGTKEED